MRGSRSDSSSSRSMRVDLLSSDFADAPADYTHESFESTDITKIQGLVYMPRPPWLYGQLTCAVLLVCLAFGQLFVGLIVMNYDSLRGESGHTCGATTVASSVLSFATAGFSVLIWRLFQPRPDPRTGKRRNVAPDISKAELSACGDPRRWSLLSVALALPMCLAAAIVDGEECVAPLRAIDLCTGDPTASPDPAYPLCTRSGHPGSFCACGSPSGSGGYTCEYLMKVA